ncbi:MAG: hypothetical protein Q8L79_14235 [Methylobacter sp.]|uniref:hypothetical protein n=1 Tax=Methylobacter sp. TaxID=2051955 RepID=UPI0027311187|nr:hypothetical protein [Methylobacter sp.]MDP1666267.1 hypothetical protein [Methylobacter sp.]
MRKLVAGFILIMILPVVAKAQAPTDVQPPESSPEALPPGSNPQETPQEKSTGSADAQSDAFNICLRATQRFEQQERAKGNKKSAEAPLSASCKTELKPASYWLCMDKEAIQKVDFNTAHWRCAKQTNLIN